MPSLLDSSSNAILTAQRAGLDDGEIARETMSGHLIDICEALAT
jgi:hypothetical protein